MGRIFCLECTHKELSECHFCSEFEVGNENKMTKCHNHTYVKCRVCRRVHADKYWTVKCVYCKQRHCIGCRCEKWINCAHNKMKLVKCFTEYDKSNCFVVQEYNERKYNFRYHGKYKSKRPVVKQSKRKDKRANVKSKRKFHRRHQMSLQY